MKNSFFVKALFLGLFTIALHASVYVKYTELPKKLYVGQVFQIRLETIPLEQNQKIYFDFDKKRGKVKVLNPLKPLIDRGEIKTYYTFYMQVLAPKAVTPDIVITVIEEGYSGMEKKKLEGVALNATKLNPDKYFSHVLARDMSVESYQASMFDKERNIIAIKLKGEYANMADFDIDYASKSGIEKISGEVPDQSVAYYAVLPQELDSFTFSYFDLDRATYIKESIPVDVHRESVSTQSELNPQNSKLYQLKLITTITVLLLFVILFALRRRWPYLVIALAAGIYLFVILQPLKTVSLQSDTKVYILPTKNATAFMKTSSLISVKELDRYEEYVKVEFDSGIIGWVKKERTQ